MVLTLCQEAINLFWDGAGGGYWRHEFATAVRLACARSRDAHFIAQTHLRLANRGIKAMGRDAISSMMFD